jgi:hypothetical protein
MKPVLETKSTYKGYPYVVLFMPGAYRCGYVGVPYSHKLAKKSVDKLSHLICHGGVTYAKSHLYNCDDKDTWWIGFDCAHCFDGYDVDAAKQYFGDDPDFKKFFSYNGRLLERVKQRFQLRNGFQNLFTCLCQR